MKIKIKNYKNLLVESRKKRKETVLKLIKEIKELSSNILDFSGDKFRNTDSGFCEYNPQINEYAMRGPDELAEVIIFVYATIQTAWVTVVPYFPLLMDWLRKQELLSISDKYIEGLPPVFETGPGKSMLMSQHPYILNVWNHRENIYNVVSPIVKKWKNGGKLERADALFKLFTALAGLDGLAAAKAGFAVQLITGQYGCVDSVNSQYVNKIIQDLEDEELKQDLTDLRFSATKKYDPEFGAPFRRIPTGTKRNSAINKAKNYKKLLDFLADVFEVDSVSKPLWDIWVEIIATKIRTRGTITLDMGELGQYGIGNKSYPKKAADVPRQRYLGTHGKDITGTTVSRQHRTVMGPDAEKY